MAELRPIPGFPGYLASDDGTIWTQKLKGGNNRAAGRLSSTPRPLKTHQNKDGYLRVCFDLNGRVFTRFVHCLILETFVGPAPDGTEACHYPDPTRTNNALNNLRWDTRLENVHDRYRDRPEAAEKECKRCHVIKPIGDFYRDRRASDGLHTECKPCHRQIAAATCDQDKKRRSNREYMRRRRASHNQNNRR